MADERRAAAAEDIVIEPATRADTAAVHRIEEASFPAPWRREFFVHEVSAEGRFNLVARRKGVVVGYLFARLRDLRWGPWAIILSSALLRATYHLYQGFGAFVGNFAMGLLFGWLYTRYGRLMPLVIAHTLIDATVFVGYAWAAGAFPGVFAPVPTPTSTPSP